MKKYDGDGDDEIRVEFYRKNDVAEVARDVTELLGHIHFWRREKVKNDLQNNN